MVSWFSKLKTGLGKTSTSLSEGLKDVFIRKKLDNETCEALEDALIMADMGADTALKLVEELRSSHFEKDISEEEIRAWLAEKIAVKLSAIAQPLTLPTPENGPVVILMVGVNGSGKTTTIGKLTAQYKAQGKKVMLAAGDTFRAGAAEQLSVWAARSGVEIELPHKEGADAAGVIFKAYERAKATGCDILLADTAGRLQNRKELMDELEKIVRVIKKHAPEAPHATLLVLDATVGQNAYAQVDAFKSTANITGVILTKLDSTAKGGVVVGLADKYALPIHMVGVGEGIDDLHSFNAEDFAKALMDI